MKIIVRAFVLVLAVTGAAASTQTPKSSLASIASTIQPSVMPAPTCPPGTGGDNPCNIRGR